jgi:hypothetical protein
MNCRNRLLQQLSLAAALVTLSWSISSSAGTLAPVPYKGGPIAQPYIVTLYWGPSDATLTSDQTVMQTYLANLALYLSGSESPQGQEPTVKQYGVRGAVLSTTSYVDTSSTNITIDNSGVWHATHSAVSKEIARLQSDQPSLLPPYGPYTLILVLTDGITFDDGYGNLADGGPGWCASHNSVGTGEYYAIAPSPVGGCTQSGQATDLNWQWRISHEVQEFATDPDVTSGWLYGVTNGNANEIGDPCNSNTTIVTSNDIIVQTVVDNITNTCAAWTTEQYSSISDVQQNSGDENQADDLVVLDSNEGIDAFHIDTGTICLNPPCTPSWTPLNGVGTSAPIAVPGAAGLGTVDAFVQGTNNAYYHQGAQGGTWPGAWADLGGVFAGPPGVVSWGQNRIDIVGLGMDGQYYHAAWNGGSWGAMPWAPITGRTFNGPPAIASHAAGSFDVFGRGTDGHYYVSQWSGGVSGAFSSWNGSPFGGLTLVTEPVVTETTSSTDVFGVDTSGATHHIASSSSGQWGSWNSLGGVALGPPAVSWIRNVLFSVVQGTNSDYYYADSSSNGTWTNFSQIRNGSGFGAATIAFATNSPFDATVDVEGGDHNIWSIQFSGAVWTRSWATPFSTISLH